MRKIAPPLALALLIVLGFWRQVFHGSYSFMNFPDLRTQWYPWFAFLSASLGQGILPLWNPHGHAGDSFIGEPQVGLFYPPTLLLALLARGAPVSLKMFSLYIVAHCVVAGLGCFALARQLRLRPWPAALSGLVFGFGGFVMSRTTAQLNLLIGSALMPTALALWLAALRSRREPARALLLAATSGAVAGLGILAGHAQPAIVTFLVMPILALPQLLSCQVAACLRRCGRAALLGLVSALVAGATAAVQLLPSAHYMRGFLRWYSENGPWPAAEPAPYEFISDLHRATPRILLRSLFEPFPDVPLPEGGQFIGGLALFLAIAGVWLARRRALKAALFGLTVAALAFSLGRDSALHGLLTELVPGVAQTRSPARMTLVSSLSLALLAGLGAETATSKGRHRQVLARSLLFVAGLLAVLWLQSEILDSAQRVGDTLAEQVLVLGIAGAILSSSLPSRSSLLALLLGLLVFQQLYTGVVVQRADAVDSPTVQFVGNPITAYLREHAGVSRVSNVDNALGTNAGTVLGFQELMGFKSGMPQSHYEFMGHAWTPRHPAFPLLACNYLGTRKPDADCAGWPEVMRWDDIVLCANPAPFPRYWFTTDFEVLEAEETMRQLGSGRWDAFDRALLAERPSLEPLPMRKELEASVVVKAIPGQRLEIEVNAPTPGLLVLSERFDPGWRYLVNDVPTQPLRAFHAFTALELAPGASRVVARYVPAGLRLGGAVSLATWGLLAAAWAIAYRRRRRHLPDESPTSRRRRFSWHHRHPPSGKEMAIKRVHPRIERDLQ